MSATRAPRAAAEDAAAPRRGSGPRSWPARLGAGWTALVARQRARRPWLDHLARAGGRYRRTQGDLMAAGVTYFVFLGLIPVLLLIASLIGLVLSGNALLQQELYAAIRATFPGPTGEEITGQVRAAVGSARVVGVIGLAGVLYAGLRAMDKLRIGLDRIWKGRADEPQFLRDTGQDLLSLGALGLAGLLSLALTGGVTQATTWLLEQIGLAGTPGLAVLTALLGLGLALATNTVVFLWLLKVVPAIAHPVRLLLPGALFGAVGFELMKLAGSLYLSLISGSVTASAFGGAVGILVWINLVARFGFFTAAWTATLSRVQRAGPEVPDRPAPVVPPAV